MLESHEFESIHLLALIGCYTNEGVSACSYLSRAIRTLSFPNVGGIKVI